MDNNKRENKLLHYVTRAAFDKDLADGLIANTSIAFIDEGRTIYTWGKEYNTSQVSQEVEQVQEQVEQIEQNWEEELNAKVEALNALILQKHADAVARAREDIQNARTSIQQVANDLASLTESCSTKSEVQTLQGQISAITNWYNLQEQSLAELSSTLDAVNARIVTEGTYTNIVNNAITQYDHEVDLKIGQAKQEMTYTNVNELTDTVVGRLMDAENGILKDYASYVQFMDNMESSVSSMVETTLNAKNPSWDTLVSKVTNVEDQADDLDAQYTSLSATVNGFSATSAQVTANTQKIAQIESSINDLGSQVTLAAVYRVINEEDVNKTIAAKIFAQANASGSNITLSADKINLSGDTTVLGNFVASKIAATDITAKALNITNASTGNSITANATNGLKFTDGTTGRNTFTLAMNGSGSIGYRTVTEEVNGETVTTYEPAISWDQNGNVQINSALIGGGGSEQTGPTYVQNPYDDQWIHDWQSTINSWKNTITTWKNELDANNNAMAYLTAAGIVFDNSAQGNIVAMTSTSTSNGTVPAGVSHTAVGGNLNGQHGYYLKNDGTGELAFGNIKWDTEGNLTVKNLTVEGNTFQSEKGHKLFRVDAICSNYSGAYIDYSIYSSGVLLKSDRFYMSRSGYYNQLGVDGNESYNTTKLFYGRNGHYTDPWDQPYEQQSVYDEFSVPFTRFQPLYSNTPVITQWTTTSYAEEYPYDEVTNYHLKCERYMTITTFGFFTALAQRCFEYPVYNVDGVLTGHTKNPNHINHLKDDSDSVYWSYWGTSDRDLLNTEPIDISTTADRAFVDVSWKEIFSVPDEDTTKYPDGRKWLIDDGENIEFWCTDHIIIGPYKSDTVGSNDNAILLSETYNTSEQRQSAINQFISSSTRERSSDKAGADARYNNGYQERFVPFYGSGHIKFKQNPYDFYENAPTPVIPNPGTEEWNTLMAYRNQELSDAQRYDNDEAIAYKVWSLTVNESRFGWETW